MSMKMVYKLGGNAKIWGIRCMFKVIDLSELDKAKAEGWFDHPYAARDAAANEAAERAAKEEAERVAAEQLEKDELERQSGKSGSGGAEVVQGDNSGAGGNDTQQENPEPDNTKSGDVQNNASVAQDNDNAESDAELKSDKVEGGSGDSVGSYDQTGGNSDDSVDESQLTPAEKRKRTMAAKAAAAADAEQK